MATAPGTKLYWHRCLTVGESGPGGPRALQVELVTTPRDEAAGSRGTAAAQLTCGLQSSRRQGLA